MSRENRAKALSLALMFILLAPVFAQQDMAEFEKRLAKINQTIQSLRAKIQAEDKRESTVLSQLDKISFNKRLLKSELDLYHVQMEKTSQELASIKKNIAGL